MEVTRIANRQTRIFARPAARWQKLETEIELLERTINDLDERLQDPEEFKEISKDPDFYAKYEKQKVDLQQLMEEWETWQQKLSKAEKRRQELDG